MANVDNKLKNIFIGAVLWLTLICFVVVWMHFAAENRQARRELIYIKAQQQAAAEKRQRLLEYEKRLKEQQLRRQYNQGRVVDISTPPAQ